MASRGPHSARPVRSCRWLIVRSRRALGPSAEDRARAARARRQRSALVCRLRRATTCAADRASSTPRATTCRRAAIAHGYFAFPVRVTARLVWRAFPATGRAPFTVGDLSTGLRHRPRGRAFWLHAPMLVGPVLAALIVLATYALARELERARGRGARGGGLVGAVRRAALPHGRHHVARAVRVTLVRRHAHGAARSPLGCAAERSRARLADCDAARVGRGGRRCSRCCLLERNAAALGVVRRGARARRGAAARAISARRPAASLARRSSPTTRWPTARRAAFAMALAAESAVCSSTASTCERGFRMAMVCVKRSASPCGAWPCTASTSPTRRRSRCSVRWARGWRAMTVRVRVLFFGCLGFMLAYAPFYFDGSYPGGGARLFADLLPLEHVLLAIALVRLDWSVRGAAAVARRLRAARELRAPRAGRTRRRSPHVRSRRAAPRGCRPRPGVRRHRPRLQPRARPGSARREHAAWWSRVTSATRTIGGCGTSSVVRRAFATRTAPAPTRRTASSRRICPTRPAPLRFEAEAEWPPLAVDHGWVQPDFVPCASHGRGLRLHPSSPSTPVALEFELPLPADRATRSVRLGWISVPGPPTQLQLTLGEASR